MENKTLVYGISAAAVVLFGGLALLWQKRKKEKEVVRAEEEGEEEDKQKGEEPNQDDPLTTIILWYEENMPKLFKPIKKGDIPIDFASQSIIMKDWQPVQENANLNVNDPSSLDRLMMGTEQLLRTKTQNGEWTYLQALFLLTVLSDAAGYFNEKEFQLNAHIIMKDEYMRMNMVDEMYHMCSLVGRYLVELQFYQEATQELQEALKYTQPLIDEPDRTDLDKLVHIRVRALSYMSQIEIAKKKLANVEYLKQIENEVRDIIKRFPEEPICIEVAKQLVDPAAKRRFI